MFVSASEAPLWSNIVELKKIIIKIDTSMISKIIVNLIRQVKTNNKK